MPFHSNHGGGSRPDRESGSDQRQQEKLRQREADRKQKERDDRARAQREKKAEQARLAKSRAEAQAKRQREADALRKQKQAEAIKAKQLKAQEEAKRKARNAVKTVPKKTPSQDLPRVMMKPPPSKPAKPKPATIFGYKVTAPKSDVQKKIDSGQATVIATRKLDSGKSLISTNKQTGRITTKAEENRMVSAGRSSTMQGGTRTSNVPLPISRPKAGGSTMAVRQVDPSGTKTMTALTPRRPSTPLTGPVYSGQPLTLFKSGGQSTRLSQLASKTGGISNTGLTGEKVVTPKVTIKKLAPITGNNDGTTSINTSIGLVPKISKPTSDFTLLRGAKRLLGSFQGAELTARKIFGNIGGIGSSFGGGSNTATTNTLIGGMAKNISNL